MADLTQQPTPQQAGAEVGNIQVLHPAGIAALGVLIALALLLPRRASSWPLVLLLCFVPAGQRAIVLSLDFSFVRLLLLAMWLRLPLRRELAPLHWHRLDRLMVLWAVAATVLATLANGSLTALVNRAGAAFDALAVYFWFRLRIRSHADVAEIAGQFLLCSPFVVALLLTERALGRNLLHFLGGVPEFTEVRDGRLRCQGAFAHPILAGCFFACLLPLWFVRSLVAGSWRPLLFGGVAASAIVALTASSTPAAAVAFTLFGAACYPIRGVLWALRWLGVLALAAIHLLREQPVWHLLSRIDLVGGSTGWHRYHLIDEFLKHRAEWFWLGTERTGHWGLGLQDVTNQFVLEAIGGGIARLLLFVALIATAFGAVARALRQRTSVKAAHAAWALGTLLFVHCMNFLAISYFEQMVVLWHLSLAAIGSTLPMAGSGRWPAGPLAGAGLP